MKAFYKAALLSKNLNISGIIIPLRPFTTHHKAEDLIREQFSNLGHQFEIPGEERVPLWHILPITQFPIVIIIVLQDVFPDLMVKLLQLCLQEENGDNYN